MNVTRDSLIAGPTPNQLSYPVSYMSPQQSYRLKPQTFENFVCDLGLVGGFSMSTLISLIKLLACHNLP